MSKHTVRLREMTDAEFTEFSRHSLDQYAREKTKAEGHSESEGRKIAEDQWQSLLPQGRTTPDHYFYVAEHEGAAIGHAWIALRKKALGTLAFVYDIELREEVRGRGLGRATMLALESQAAALGAIKMGLHVFGHNERARALYESLGYTPTNVVMEKSLA